MLCSVILGIIFLSVAVKEAEPSRCYPKWAHTIGGVLDYNTSPEQMKRYELKIKPNTIAVDPKLALKGSNAFLSFGEKKIQYRMKTSPHTGDERSWQITVKGVKKIVVKYFPVHESQENKEMIKIKASDRNQWTEVDTFKKFEDVESSSKNMVMTFYKAKKFQLLEIKDLTVYMCYYE